MKIKTENLFEILKALILGLNYHVIKKYNVFKSSFWKCKYYIKHKVIDIDSNKITGIF